MIGFIAPELKPDRRNIYPDTAIAREFIEPFCENLFSTIEKPVNGTWTTNDKYPLSPYQLWEKHQDPKCFVGVRHGNNTTHAAFDIDKKSQYHPDQDETGIEKLKAALETIGLVRSLPVRSSDSGGLHIYYPLSEKVNTFKLSCAIATTLQNHGLETAKGQLEVFPNVKAYSPNPLEPSRYSGLRLPLQQGSYILDDNLNYISNDIEVWVAIWKTAANGQDTARLKRSLDNAKKPKSLKTERRGNAAKFYNDLLSTISNGWEPDSTQNMLQTIAKLKYIFEGETDLDGLTVAIAEAAKNTKGYWENCQHTHEIEKCSRNWAKWVINLPKYYPHDSGKSSNTSKSKKVKVSRFDEVKQGLIDLLPEIGDRIFRTKVSLLEFLSKTLKTSNETLYKLQDLWTSLFQNNCNVYPDNDSSNLIETEIALEENTQNYESFTEIDITVASPNELFPLETSPPNPQPQTTIPVPAAPNSLIKTSEPIQSREFKQTMTFEQQMAIASTCPTSRSPEPQNFRLPKEPPRQNPSTLESVRAAVEVDPSSAGVRLAMLKAKLFLPTLKREERSQTEQAIAYLEKLLAKDPPE